MIAGSECQLAAVGSASCALPGRLQNSRSHTRHAVHKQAPNPKPKNVDGRTPLQELSAEEPLSTMIPQQEVMTAPTWSPLAASVTAMPQENSACEGPRRAVQLQHGLSVSCAGRPQPPSPKP